MSAWGGRGDAAQISAILSGAALRLGLSAGGPVRRFDFPPRDASEANNWGLTAFQEDTCAGLLRSAALLPDIPQQMADRFRASRSVREIGQGSAETANGPDFFHALAAPLYARGLPVQGLPISGEWLCARLDATTDLAAEMQLSRFIGWCPARSPSPEWRWSGSARTAPAAEAPMALFHGGAEQVTVMEVLRHRSPLSSRPYITNAARMADLA